MTSVLMVVSAADHWTLNDGTTHPTGFWAEEFVEPYRLFTEAGWPVAVATPGGVTPTVDAGSLNPAMVGGPERAAELGARLDSLAEVLAHPLVLADVDLDAYDVVFYPGGHGPMEDLAVDAASGALLTRALSSGKPLGVLCHAPAALLAATQDDGGWPFAGYRLTAFSNTEEEQGGLAAKAPWLLEDRLTALGAKYTSGPAWGSHIEVDRNLYTGQNPASSADLARALIAATA
jgi:putative intracellular protease/amidase